jgi:hypothetical protein
MSYLIPGVRTLIVEPKALNTIVWPAEVSVRVTLSPKEIFGSSERSEPRAMGMPGVETQFTVHGHTGRIAAHSDDFIRPLLYETKLKFGINIEFNHNVFVATCRADSDNHLHILIDRIVFWIPAYLSLFFDTFIGVEEVTGHIAPDFDLAYLITGFAHRLMILDTEQRKVFLDKAFGFVDLPVPPAERLIVATIYFQQALRLVSPHEVHVPLLNISAEVFLNLSKCLETLFGGNRDKVREKCKTIGYSDDQIEEQIIPILVVRNELDIAHPVGTRISSDDIQTLRDYIFRSIENVRSILITVSQLLESRVKILEPLSHESGRERSELCNKLRRYLQKPKLPNDYEGARLITARP